MFHQFARDPGSLHISGQSRSPGWASQIEKRWESHDGILCNHPDYWRWNRT
jgi:hypothetical protein